MTRAEMLSKLEGVDLSKLSINELGAICQRLGRSGRGNREELTATIKRAIANTQTGDQS